LFLYFLEQTYILLHIWCCYFFQ